MFLDNRTNPIEVQRHRSKVKVTGPDYRIFYHCERGKKFVGFQYFHPHGVICSLGDWDNETRKILCTGSQCVEMLVVS